MELTRSTLTGLTDTDKLVLKRLNDWNLFDMCRVDKHFRRICQDESFWRERFLEKFGPHAASYKPQDRSWRRHYLRVIRDINILLTRPNGNWDFFSLININLGASPTVYKFPYEEYIKEKNRETSFDGKFHHLKAFNVSLFQKYRDLLGKKVPIERDETASNIYWLAEVVGREKETIKLAYNFPWNEEGNIKIKYSLDYFDKLGDMWTYPRYFTPAKVTKIVEDFYNTHPKGEEIDMIEIYIEEEGIEIDRQQLETMTYLEIWNRILPDFHLEINMYKPRKPMVVIEH